MSNIIRANWGKADFYDAMTRDLVAGLQNGTITLTGFREDCNYETQIILNFTDNSAPDVDNDKDSQ